MSKQTHKTSGSNKHPKQPTPLFYHIVWVFFYEHFRGKQKGQNQKGCVFQGLWDCQKCGQNKGKVTKCQNNVLYFYEVWKTHWLFVCWTFAVIHCSVRGYEDLNDEDFEAWSVERVPYEQQMEKGYIVKWELQRLKWRRVEWEQQVDIGFVYQFLNFWEGCPIRLYNWYIYITLSMPYIYIYINISHSQLMSPACQKVLVLSLSEAPHSYLLMFKLETLVVAGNSCLAITHFLPFFIRNICIYCIFIL